MEFDWINLLQVLGGMILGGGGVFGIKAAMRKSKAEAVTAEHDADRAEVERLHLQIDHQQKSLDVYIKLEKDNAERISQQNKALDEKTEQIRKLTEQVISSEHGRNHDKEEITRLTAELGEMRVLMEHYKSWHCCKSDCDDRIPPNKKLKGLKYEPPKLTR